MKSRFKQTLVSLLCGIGIGTANVIPGVSGATIAVITGVFERLIQAIKAFDAEWVRLVVHGRMRQACRHVDLGFLAPLLAGVLIAIVSLAKLLEYLFGHYPVYVWAYFFGLILASIPTVGKTVSKWRGLHLGLALAGAVVAVALTFLNPAVENDHGGYVLLCGILAMCSMILPGVSGSFVLMLMGNYELILFRGINERRADVLLPFLLGCGVGLAGFSRLLGWLLRRAKDQTIAALTGFIAGSLVTIWPWKHVVYRTDAMGQTLMKDGHPVVFKYLPAWPTLSIELAIALIWVLLGIGSLWITEILAARQREIE